MWTKLCAPFRGSVKVTVFKVVDKNKLLNYQKTGVRPAQTRFVSSATFTPTTFSIAEKNCIRLQKPDLGRNSKRFYFSLSGSLESVDTVKRVLQL